MKWVTKSLTADCPSPSRIEEEKVEYQYTLFFGSLDLRYSNFQPLQRKVSHVSQFFRSFRIVAKSAFWLLPPRPSNRLS